MKNNRGLTLIELLGVLVVLSMIVMIVTPTVTRNLQASRIELCYHELDSLIAASKNWLTDLIDNEYDSLYVNGVFQNPMITGQGLLDGGYVGSLDDKYLDVGIQIFKVGDTYEYTLVLSQNQESIDKSVFCR